jgi:acid phosphatase
MFSSWAHRTLVGARLRGSWPFQLGVFAVAIALASVGAGVASPASGAGAGPASANAPVTPIQHVIVIVGEDHSFDNVFGTYQPPSGQSVNNLLSEGIVTASGQSGANVGLASQQQATSTTTYSIDPTKTGAYTTLPQPSTGSALGQPQNVPDTRFPANLPNAPFQITKYVPYLNSYVGAPVNRFYQMWQQVDQGKNDLFTWVGNTAATNGALQMGYYNMATGDEPDFNSWAQSYAISDNYHQAVMGGDDANHLMLGTGDAAYYSDGHGNPLVPPASQIVNPNPRPGTNNNYTNDSGTYSNCSDPNQPGVGTILSYLQSLKLSSQCAPGAYYMLNNTKPGYLPNGQLNTSASAVPPQTQPTIADELSAAGISWKYYGQSLTNNLTGNDPNMEYCVACNPFGYSTSVMTTALRNNIQDYTNFAADVTNGTVPAVSFIQPDSTDDGHPASSSLSQFETFASTIVNEVKNNAQLWNSTAIFITFDDGGGYYDSGYIQPTSFFGDGTRVPLIAISPFAKPGYVSHTYSDTASILKFIEHNWQLHTLSARSLDHLPDPSTSTTNPYVPTNGPAIGDLLDMFDFDHDLDLTNVPATITTNATSPAGATVSYTPPSVVDEDNPKPSVNCSPPSESTFAITTTTVTCTVSDPDDTNSPVSRSFQVVVKGAADQLSDLANNVKGVGPGTSLADKVATAQADLAASDKGDACMTLNAFINQVHAQAGKKIAADVAALRIADAQRIEAVIPCSS